MPTSINTVANPEAPNADRNARLFAVIGAWMEADVVSSTVKNALTQGCERVYLVDNDSPDETIVTAIAAGATLARTFETAQYDESLRLRHMNSVMETVTRAEDAPIWWLFLDGDEFPHGPWGMTLLEYLRTLDRRFRVVGMRCFDHYPGGPPYFARGRHPLDFQPLCEELAFPMCPALHRKHSLVRFDPDGPLLSVGTGFHLIECRVPLDEPAQPAFLHHFPYRDPHVTRARLDALWAKDATGATRAAESRDTHMLARVRSLAAVYGQNWAEVVNFISLDPMYEHMDPKPPAKGVHLRPWHESVPPEHQNVLRWYSMMNAWKYGEYIKFGYGDDTTYVSGMAFLDGHGGIEDWGCGFAHAKAFVRKSQYTGLDGSSGFADRIVDLTTWRSTADCIFMRHVLEHNTQWKAILGNALASFTKRMVLVVFTPYAETTRVIATTTGMTAIPVPDIAFSPDELRACFAGIRYREESVRTDTQYGIEHVFYLEK